MDLLEDIRDRLIRLEDKIDGKFVEVDKRLKPLEQHVERTQWAAKKLRQAAAAGIALLTAWFTFLSTKSK